MFTKNQAGRTSLLAVIGGLGALAAGSAGAATTHNESNAIAEAAPAVATHMTDGARMAGMEVTVRFSNGTTESDIWSATGPTAGEASGNGWALKQDGDTFTNLWYLTYQNMGQGLLVGFSIDGFAAGIGDGVMFDRTKDDLGFLDGTPNSAFGRDFITNPDPFPAFDIAVFYSNPVGVGGNAPLGDVYRYIDVSFRPFAGTGLNIAGLDGDVLTAMEFIQDTDTPEIVPEPASLALIAMGGALILGRRGRRA